MANHDDLSADLERGSEEPDRGSVEPIGPAALPSVPGLPPRAARIGVASSAAKSGPSTRPLRTRPGARPLASEAVPELDRAPAGTDAPAVVIDDDRTRRVAAPVLDAADPNVAGGRGGVLRQGLPRTRTGGYRTSAVTRSLRATPVAGTPITEPPAATPARVAATPDAPAKDESAMHSLTDPPRRYVVTVRRPASDPAIAAVADGSAAPPDAHLEDAGVTSGAIVATAPVAAEAPDPARSSTGADAAPGAALPASIEIERHIPVEILDAPPAELVNAARMRIEHMAAEAEGLPPLDASVIERVSRWRSRSVRLGLLGAAVVGAALLVVALRSSRGAPHPAQPAAADLVHAVSPAAVDVAPPAAPPRPAASPRVVEVAAPEAATPAAPTPAPPAPAAVKPAPPVPVAARPATPPAPAHAASAPPARPSPPREPARPAKSASPPRAAPARPLTYDPDALFLPKQ
ncbi:MAG TPA: hypothetical protein VHW23_05805 [Kofleriaceae bacterium]|nr:hypothetical protein [Kofleriaceae bacterium]